MGDLKENGYYKASRAKLSFIDSRLFHLKLLMKRAEIIEAPKNGLVGIGCRVIISNGTVQKEYQIVGEFESNPAESKLSEVSPIGKELLGKRVGDSITVKAPIGMMNYTIVKIID